MDGVAVEDITTTIKLSLCVYWVTVFPIIQKIHCINYTYLLPRGVQLPIYFLTSIPFPFQNVRN